MAFLETARLQLRELTQGDFVDLAQILLDRDVMTAYELAGPSAAQIPPGRFRPLGRGAEKQRRDDRAGRAYPAAL